MRYCEDSVLLYIDNLYIDREHIVNVPTKRSCYFDSTCLDPRIQFNSDYKARYALPLPHSA